MSFDIHTGGHWPDKGSVPSMRWEQRDHGDNWEQVSVCAYCGSCRLPDPIPAGWALREHDDPEGLL